MQVHGKAHLGALVVQLACWHEDFVPLNVALAMSGRSGCGWGFGEAGSKDCESSSNLECLVLMCDSCDIHVMTSSPHFTQRTCSFCGAGGYGTSGIEISQEIEPGANANSWAKKTCEALGIEHLQGTKRELSWAVIKILVIYVSYRGPYYGAGMVLAHLACRQPADSVNCLTP